MINPLKELLSTSPKVIAKFIFEVGLVLETLTDEYDALKKEKSEKENPEPTITQGDSIELRELQSKYQTLWDKHQDLLRSIQK